jgi:hypothetical protein
MTAFSPVLTTEVNSGLAVTLPSLPTGAGFDDRGDRPADSAIPPLLSASSYPPAHSAWIAVESWDSFALLKERLVATGDFTSNRRALQRLTYSDQATGFSIPVDLIPFRGVTAAHGTLKWPPSRDTVMNVAGFEEALASSVQIQIEENLIARVASIPGLMILKLVAWSDRGRETDKDAADISIASSWPMLTPETRIASTRTKWICWRPSVLTCNWQVPNCWAAM